jgi:hypothetical protein
MSSTQLESPQSEVRNSRYELSKMAMSAVLADSECFTNSYVSPWIQNEYCLILDRVKLMKFLNYSNCIYLNRRSIARDIEY